MGGKRDRDMSKGIGPTGRTRHDTGITGRIDRDKSSIAAERDGDQIVFRHSLDTVLIETPVETERAERIRDDLDRALKAIKEDTE